MMRSVLSSMCIGLALVCLVLGGCDVPAGCNPQTGCGRAPVADPNNPGHQTIPVGPNDANGKPTTGLCNVRGSIDGDTCAYAATPTPTYPVADDCTGYGQSMQADPNNMNDPPHEVDNTCACKPIRATALTTNGCSCSPAAPNGAHPGTHHANPNL